MAKLTWKSLTGADPAVHGDGYQLRYRKRKGGTYAELRYKPEGGKWTSYRLGRVPSEAEVRVLNDPLLTQVGVGLLLKMDERTIEQLSPDPSKPIPVDLALDPIREKARVLYARLAHGQDPRGGQSPDSLGAVGDLWLATKGDDWSPRTLPERRRHLTRDWAPFRGRAVASLTWQELQAHLERIKRRELRDEKGRPYGGAIAANRSRGTLHALCKWAKVNPNPVALVDRAVREKGRERVLSLDELRAIWQAAGDGDHGVIVRLLMLTGQRREEVGGMRWSELDLDRGLWTLPGARTKNKEPHTVPLSAQAVELLRAVELRPGRDNLFGNGAGSFSGWSRSKARLDGRCGVADWTLHDLRRSFASGWQQLSVRLEVTEKALNHVSGSLGGIVGVYQRYGYADEIARAMQLWADHLLQVEPAKVIALRP